MGILTVRAPDSQQAMEEVLRRLGPDAYILSTSQRDGMIEIRAARDLPPPAPSSGQTFGDLLEARRRETTAERPALVAERIWMPPSPAKGLTPLPRGIDAMAQALLSAALADLPSRVVIVGPPGAGKTMLALRFAALLLEERPGCEPLIVAPRLGFEAPDARLRHWSRLVGLELTWPQLADLAPAPWPAPDPARPEIVDLSCAPDAGPALLADLLRGDSELILALPAGLSPRMAGRLAADFPGATLCLTRTDLWAPDAAEIGALAASGLSLGWESCGTGIVDVLRRIDRARLDEWAADWPEGSEPEKEERQ